MNKPHAPKKAGRPVGSGRYGEETKVMRVPVRLEARIRDMLMADALDADAGADAVPLFGGRVQAGLPSSTDDFMEARVNLHAHLVKDAEQTFLVRAQGQSMVGAGIFDGDLLVVDRNRVAKHGNIVVAALDGELTVKRLDTRGEGLRLLPENPSYPVIEVGPEQDCHVWGVVTSVVHEF